MTLLYKPFAEIERLIQNIIILIREKQEINNSSGTIEELKVTDSIDVVDKLLRKIFEV
ncbi:hypothetical protein RhiirA5_356837 [Rhizophagus irregularis]|nr:hypothetical protein RhiirA5_356837 [Rhizophagus irregularis]